MTTKASMEHGAWVVRLPNELSAVATLRRWPGLRVFEDPDGVLWLRGRGNARDTTQVPPLNDGPPVYINGFEISDIVPEPGSLALLALGSLLLRPRVGRTTSCV